MLKMLACLFAVATMSCTTIEKDAETADGRWIPGKRFLQFAEYEYICEPTFDMDHTSVEKLLDRYGRKGWTLAGFIQKNGDTNAFCVMR